MTTVKEYTGKGLTTDRTEVSFNPSDFIHLIYNTMQWRELEKEMTRTLRPVYDNLFGEDMMLIDKIGNIISHKKFAIYNLKKHYYKTGSLYKITIVINGFEKD